MKLAIKNLFGIRFKLVFLSSFLLVIPWLGYRYILEMEEYLQLGQEQTVLGTAQALATALNERPELFSEGSYSCLLYTSPSPRDKRQSRMPSSA